MIHKLTQALRHLANNVADGLGSHVISEVCRTVGHSWRARQLDPVTTIHLFILQLLNRNTACTHLPRLVGQSFSASAYCQARASLPLAVLQELLNQTCVAIRPLAAALGRWRGHRTWHVDGSGVSMPDTADLQKAFGQPSNQAPGCGFPVARILTLFHAGTGFLIRMLVAPLDPTKQPPSPRFTRSWNLEMC